MAKRDEEIKAIFIGPEFVSIGNVIEKDNTLSFKKIPSKPFIDKYSTIMGNISKYKREKKKLYDPLKGKTNEEIVIFGFDLLGNKYRTNINDSLVVENETLKQENQYLQIELEKIKQKLISRGNIDLRNKEFKDQQDWLTKVKYGSEGNGGGGSSFGGSPFGFNR